MFSLEITQFSNFGTLVLGEEDYINDIFHIILHPWQYKMYMQSTVFHCITHSSCQILSFIQAFLLHTNRLKVDADYIPELGFFSRDFGRK